MTNLEALKRALDHYEKHRHVFAEVSKKTRDALDKAVTEFLREADPLAELNWDEFVSVLDTLNHLQKKPADADSRLAPFGLKYPTKTGRRAFAMSAVRSGVARQVIAELRRSPEETIRAQISELAKASDREKRIRKLSDKEIKALLTWFNLKLKTKSKDAKREEALRVLGIRLAEEASRLGAS